MPFEAIILAGGKSKRMGRDKATLEIEGKAMIVHILDALKSAGCNNVLIQIKSPETQKILSPLVSDYDVIWGFDEGNESDILQALYSALNTALKHQWDFVQLVPIDTPFLSSILFEKLTELCKDDVEVVIPSSNSSKNTSSKGLEPLLSYVKVKPAIKKISDARKYKDNRLVKIFCEMNHIIIEQPQWEKWGITEKSFKNLNYPKDCE